MKELLRIYTDSITKIFENFGLKNGYGEISIHTNVKWCLNTDEEVRWIEGGCLYANEIIGKPHYYQNYMMAYVNDGCGNSYYQIFDINLMDNEIEE